MKFKMLVAMALCSFLAATFCYAESDMQIADDTNVSNSMAPQSSAADNQLGNPPTQNNDSSNPGAMSENTPGTSSNSNDDMSADTATGDDDY